MLYATVTSYFAELDTISEITENIKGDRENIKGDRLLFHIIDH